MKKYKYELSEIIEKIDINQQIILKNGTKLIVKSKPYYHNNHYYVECLKEGNLTKFSINYWYENELVIKDSQGLFLEKTIMTMKYKNKCWHCQSKIDSDYCERCDNCGWYICKKCNSCKKLPSQRILGICNW